jgi:hypothetical protein
VESTRSTRARAAWILALLCLPTALFLRAQLDLQVDVENTSLKSVGTPEAEHQAQRIRSFGRDEEVIVVFRARPAQRGPADEAGARALTELAGEVRALAGVAELVEAPPPREGVRVWSVRLDTPDGGYAPAVEELERLVRAGTPASMQAAVSGQPVGEIAIARELQAEQQRIVPLLGLALVVLLLLYYRHAGLVAAILVPALLGIAWTMGAFAFAGRELNPVSVMLQPVLLTVGVASGVHWAEAYLDQLTAGHSVAAAARGAVEELRKPALLAALTTVIGFLSLSFNSIPAVVDFGVFAALGIGLTHAIASVATPALLVLVARQPGARMMARRGKRVDVLGLPVADWLARHAAGIRVGAVLVAALALMSALGLRVDNDPQRVLPEDHPFRQDTALVTRELGGSEAFDLLVPRGSRLADPIELGLFLSWATKLPAVAGAAGPPLVSDDGSWLARLVLQPTGSTAREELFDSIEARARALGAPEVHVTGTAVRVARDSGRLIRSTLSGTLAALAALFVVFWVGFRSAYYAGLALVPNVLPGLVVYGGLAAFDVPLSFATAMISSTMLGLIVDDTIHLLHRYRIRRAEGHDELAAIEHVYRHAGRAILITSVVLGVGFSIGMFGRLSTTAEFSTVAAITIAVAFVSDLVLLPAILVRSSARVQLAVEAVHA